MSPLMQHLLVLVIVLACLAVVVGGLVRTLWGKRSQLGKCCSRGCGETTQAKPAAERVIFFPSNSLRVRKHGDS